MKRRARFTSSLILMVVLFSMVVGCGNPTNRIEPTPMPFNLLSEFRTVSYPNATAYLNDQLFVGGTNFFYPILDVSDPFGLVVTDSIIPSAGGIRKIRNIEITEGSDLIAIQSDITELYSRDSLKIVTSFGSQGGNGVLTAQRRAEVYSLWNGELTETDVFQLVLSETGDDGIFKTFLYPDSGIIFGDTVYTLESLRHTYGVDYMGKSARGIQYYRESLDTLVVGIGEIGVGFLDTYPTEIGDGQNNFEWLNTIDTPGEASNSVVVGDYIYVADMTGIAVIHAPDIESASYITSWHYDAATHLKKVYYYPEMDEIIALDEFDGVFFIDISNPDNPETIYFEEVRGAVSAEITDAGIMYLCSSERYISVMDLNY